MLLAGDAAWRQELCICLAGMTSKKNSINKIIWTEDSKLLNMEYLFFVVTQCVVRNTGGSTLGPHIFWKPNFKIVWINITGNFTKYLVPARRCTATQYCSSVSFK